MVRPRDYQTRNPPGRVRKWFTVGSACAAAMSVSGVFVALDSSTTFLQVLGWTTAVSGGVGCGILAVQAFSLRSR
jgi:hypothetical protein